MYPMKNILKKRNPLSRIRIFKYKRILQKRNSTRKEKDALKQKDSLNVGDMNKDKNTNIKEKPLIRIKYDNTKEKETPKETKRK